MQAPARVLLILVFCAACARQSTDELPPLPASVPPPSGDTASAGPNVTPYPPGCDKNRFDAGNYTYAADRLAYLEFVDAMTHADDCWLFDQGILVHHRSSNGRGVNVTLPDSFTGDLRKENPRIVKFSVRMR